MALCNFGHFYIVSKISQKLLEIELHNLINRLVVIWAFLPCQQNISKTVGARALKLDELIGYDE